MFRKFDSKKVTRATFQSFDKMSARVMATRKRANCRWFRESQKFASEISRDRCPSILAEAIVFQKTVLQRVHRRDKSILIPRERGHVACDHVWFALVRARLCCYQGRVINEQRKRNRKNEKEVFVSVRVCIHSHDVSRVHIRRDYSRSVAADSIYSGS